MVDDATARARLGGWLPGLLLVSLCVVLGHLTDRISVVEFMPDPVQVLQDRGCRERERRGEGVVGDRIGIRVNEPQKPFVQIICRETPGPIR